ncbi:hypothetical protein HMPREF0023_2617 [Acinetobacter sp. ATCC 27244]|nr:hypothetical protein HMPREF0023_2617 [Acinetobacter sp. ATCC 27244]
MIKEGHYHLVIKKQAQDIERSSKDNDAMSNSNKSLKTQFRNFKRE